MLYYYIKEKEDGYEQYDSYYGKVMRNYVILEHKNYPTHRHETIKRVDIRQLFSKSEFERCLALTDNRYKFSTIELNKDKVFKDIIGNRYCIEFEKENNTKVWKEYIK